MTLGREDMVTGQEIMAGKGSKPWARVAILLTGLFALAAISKALTGSVLPTNSEQALIFQNALLLLVLGSALLEHKFTKPADSLVNAVMAALTMIAVHSQAQSIAWWGTFSYCVISLLLAAICTAVSSGPEIGGWQERVARITYRPAVVLGGARRIFSVVFLYGVFSYYDLGSIESAVLIVFWGAFIVLWPLGVPELLSLFSPRSNALKPLGKVVRTDWPDLVRCSLRSDAVWTRDSVKTYQQADGAQRYVLPLYAQVQEESLLGTGLCIADLTSLIPGLEGGYIYDAPATAPASSAIAELLGGSPTSKLVGFVVEDSEIGQIRLETWDPAECKEGMIVWCRLNGTQVFYQITSGLTREEAMESDRHGFQVAVAAQLGVLDRIAGFKKYDWLPTMNTPVFSEPDTFGAGIKFGKKEDFWYGCVPNSNMKVTGDFQGSFDHHTAILGVTGSGKTELAFDLIRHAIASDIKIVCIDLTARYQGRLSDLSPRDLSVSPEVATALSQKLFDVETGNYGAGKEKKVLEEFSGQLKNDISESLEHFLISTAEEDRVGIIRLEEISNTKATLYITELYLTCLLRFAKDHSGEAPRTLVVVEEAHTVMPEASTMGLGDFDSKGLVGKIAQIALQGRKYHVGLLVIAQRTATVSKSVLTQCNTIISFTCFDDTSLGFLKNIFGPTHISLIPNLSPLQAVVFGRGIRSQRPVVVQIPFDAAKAERVES